MIVPIKVRISTSVTTNVATQSSLIFQIIIACSNAGTGWTLTIQDEATPAPFVLIPAFTLTVPTNGIPINSLLNLQEPLLMENGMDIITAGTPGVVSIWMITEQ